jgi:hypothetical protein
MRKAELLTRPSKLLPGSVTRISSRTFSTDKVLLGRAHFHVIVERPAAGGTFENIIDLGDQQPPRTDEFVVIPAGWDLYFADQATGDPVEGPVHGLTVTAEGWFDSSDGHCKVQIRASLQNAKDNLHWYGQIAVDGLAFGPK